MKKIVIILCLIFFCQICAAGITTTTKNNEISRTQQISKSVDSSFFNKIHITGHGTTFLLRPLMRSGVGFCFFIRVSLGNDGYIEISKKNNQNDAIILNGEKIVDLIGFCGIFDNGGCNADECYPMEIQGISILTMW